MSTEPDPRQIITYEGKEVPYGAAEAWVLLLEHAAAVATYVALPQSWPGYVAWLEQQLPGYPLEAGSDAARQDGAEDAAHLCDMAYIAREKLERAAGTGEY